MWKKYLQKLMIIHRKENTPPYPHFIIVAARISRTRTVRDT